MDQNTRAKKRKRKNKEQNGNYLLYAVSKGKITGLFKNWLSCSHSVIGIKSSAYKGFNDLESAKQYLKESGTAVKYISCTESDFLKPNFEEDTKSIDSFSTMSLDNVIEASTSAQQSTTGHGQVVTSCHLCPQILDQITKLITRVDALENIIMKQNGIISTLNTEMEANKEQIVERNSSLIKEEFLKLNESTVGLSDKITTYADKAAVKPKKNEILRRIPKNAEQRNKIPFEPKRSFVIYDLQPTEIPNINIDKIRMAICQRHGSTKVDFINRYKFDQNNLSKCKFLIQLYNQSDLKKIVEQWDESTFGGSKARFTIQPVPHVAVVKGVPLHMTPEYIVMDVNADYRCTTAYRITTTDGKPLRAVKLQFLNDIEKDRAIQNGVVFRIQYNILPNVEELRHKKSSND